MKRAVLLIFILLTLLTGCRQEYGILDYQTNNISAECVINEKYKVLIDKDSDTISLTIKEPENLEDVIFILTEDKVQIAKNDLKIPAEKNDFRGICAILNIFSLKEESIIEARKNNTVLFKNEYGTYQVEYGKGSLPQKVLITDTEYEYSIVINGIKTITTE